jgi:hypothetical protein
MENIVVSIRHCDGCDKLFGPAVLEIKSKTANSWPILEHVEEICYLPQSLMIKIKSNRNENLLLSATITHTLFDQVLFVTYQEAEVPAQGTKSPMKMISSKICLTLIIHLR